MTQLQGKARFSRLSARVLAPCAGLGAALVLAAGPALAQTGLSGQMAAGPELMIQFVINMGLALVMGIILLIARTNMRGWRQPLGWVWFSFQGRLNRKAYWLKGGVLLPLLQFLFGAAVTVITFAMSKVGFAGGEAVLGFAILALAVPFFGFYFWASLAVFIKRLHDCNKSGWFMLLMLVPVLNLWPLILALFIKGTEGANAYGFDPLDEDFVDAGQDDTGDADAGAAHPDVRPGSASSAAQAAGGFGHGRRKRPLAAKPQDSGPTPPPVRLGADGSPDQQTVRDRLGLGYATDAPGADDAGPEAAPGDIKPGDDDRA